MTPPNIHALRHLAILGFITLLLTACARPTEPATTATATVPLTPYSTATQPAQQTAAPTADLTLAETATALPSPTSTPRVYSIVEGDTLLGIAYRFGISLEEILAANPAVDPNFLTIGNQIILPASAQDTVTPAEPTPVPLTINQPDCLEDATGGAWCYAWVENETNIALENVIVQINLRMSNSTEPASELALTPLSLLLPGEKLPALGYFIQYQASAQAEAELVSALPISEVASRYLEHTIEIENILYGSTSDSAQIKGAVIAGAGQVDARLVRIAALAFNQQGQLVGFRQVELDGPLPAGAQTSYEITVYSLVDQIVDVEVISELIP